MTKLVYLIFSLLFLSIFNTGILASANDYSFYDDFNDGDYTNNPTWTIVTPGWTVVDGVMRSDGGESSWDNIQTEFAQDGNYIYEWRYRHPTEGTTNFHFNIYETGDGDETCEDGEYYYVYRTYQEEYIRDLAVDKCVNGVFITLWQSDSHPHQVGQWYNAMVIANSEGLEIRRDDILITTISDASIRTGNSLSVQAYWHPKEFDDYRVRENIPQIDDNNKGHGNDPNGIDDDNPGRGCDKKSDNGNKKRCPA